MTLSGNREAWSDFWRDPMNAGEGCLKGSKGPLGNAQARTWKHFASTLPPKARVLDIGTGNGIVLSYMREVRRDLRLTGIDSAPVLPRAPAGVTLTSGVGGEQLGFKDSSWDAVTSQFGYEYTDTARTAPEIARVLKPSGKFLIVAHHAGGPVLEHNLARAAAIRWAAVESGLLSKAKALAGARTTVALPTPAAFHEAVAEAQRRFPPQGGAVEFVTAIFHALDPRQPATQSLGALAELERKAGFELARIEALAAAAQDSHGINGLASELEAAGLVVKLPQVLTDHFGHAIAWLLGGRK